jgi:hypothetical protein
VPDDLAYLGRLLATSSSHPATTRRPSVRHTGRRDASTNLSRLRARIGTRVAGDNRRYHWRHVVFLSRLGFADFVGCARSLSHATISDVIH